MPSPAEGPAELDAELSLLADADARARIWTAGIGSPGRRVTPDAAALDALDRLAEPLSADGRPAAETLAVLDEVAGAAVVASNDPRYFGFVTGATLPVAAAAERLVLAWDQCAASQSTSAAAAGLERIAGRWVLDILDLPRHSAVGFTTGSGVATLTALLVARRELLRRKDWDVDRRGLSGAPPLRVICSDLIHATVLRAVRAAGFGLDNVVPIATDSHGRALAEHVPPLDDTTIVIVQAGEVNTGECDDFTGIVARARAAGAWVHIDGAFGLWARAAPQLASLTTGVDGADSWSTDAHKWLNTPYDGAMCIIADADAAASTLDSDAVYLTGTTTDQKNLTLDHSRRARGVAVWAVLRTLGPAGVEHLVVRSVELARYAAAELARRGFTVVNRVVLNQVLVVADDDPMTLRIAAAVHDGGRAAMSTTRWQGRAAIRISVTSWRTRREHIDALVVDLAAARASG